MSVRRSIAGGGATAAAEATVLGHAEHDTRVVVLERVEDAPKPGDLGFRSHWREGLAQLDGAVDAEVASREGDELAA